LVHRTSQNAVKATFEEPPFHAPRRTRARRRAEATSRLGPALAPSFVGHNSEPVDLGCKALVFV
jgi:hypothetical protein